MALSAVLRAVAVDVGQAEGRLQMNFLVHSLGRQRTDCWKTPGGCEMQDETSLPGGHAKAASLKLTSAAFRVADTKG
jgi:hypothetical protein